MKELTDRQNDILGFLAERAVAGWPPSVREICEAFAISSLRGCTVHLDALERKGMLKRGHLSREITLTLAGIDAVRAYRPLLGPQLLAYQLMRDWDGPEPEERLRLICRLRDAHCAEYPRGVPDSVNSDSVLPRRTP